MTILILWISWTCDRETELIGFKKPPLLFGVGRAKEGGQKLGLPTLL